MTTPHQPTGGHRPADPYLDMRARWCPSPTQDADAAAALTRQAQRRADRADTAPTAAGEAAGDGVFTVQLLIGKHHGVWTPEVEVLAVPGVYYSREAALAACAGARATHRLLRPDRPVTASYCWHHDLAPPTDPARSDDGRPWRTHWSTFEDLSGEPDEPGACGGH